MYSTPSEFLRDLLRSEKDRQDAASIREGIIEGFQNIQQRETIEYQGSLKDSIKQAEQTWKVWIHACFIPHEAFFEDLSQFAIILLNNGEIASQGNISMILRPLWIVSN